MKPDELEPMSPAMRALLDAEKPLDKVPAATRAKLLAKLSATAAGAGAGLATTAAATTGAKAGGAAAGAATSTALATKVLIAAVAFSIGGGVGAGVHAVVAPRVVQTPAPIVITVVRPEPFDSAQDRLQDREAVVEPKGAETPAPAPVKPSPPRPKDTLGAERSLIEQARAALSRHEPGAALSALSEHERDFGNGQLAEERLALQVLAHSENGDAAKARELAAKFKARYPKSLLMPAVEAAERR